MHFKISLVVDKLDKAKTNFSFDLCLTMFVVFLASLFNRLFFKLLLLNYARTFSVSRDFKEGDIGIFCIAVLWWFFVQYFWNFAASVRYFVLSIQAVSVFIEFSTRYCGISRFFPGIAVQSPPQSSQCPPL